MNQYDLIVKFRVEISQNLNLKMIDVMGTISVTLVSNY